MSSGGQRDARWKRPEIIRRRAWLVDNNPPATDSVLIDRHVAAEMEIENIIFPSGYPLRDHMLGHVIHQRDDRHIIDQGLFSLLQEGHAFGRVTFHRRV